MANAEKVVADIKLSSMSEPSLQSDFTPPTSVSLETFSDDDDDVWGTSEGYQRYTDGSQAPAAGEEMLSDLPAMQRQHMTAGYREGLSDSKAKSMQGGFDQGYPIGFELGLRVGKIFGMLEGFLAAFAKDKATTPIGLVELYARAKKELAISQLLNGLDDEELARPEFEFKDLPLKGRDAVQKWEELMMKMME